MKCNSCGFETEQNFDYCPNCGTAVTADQTAQQSQAEQPAQPVSLNPAADKISEILNDNLFLVVCILMSVSSALSLVNKSFPIINILFTIFLWLAYAQNRKGITDPKYLRYVSGTVFAGYILNYVLFGLIFLAGILLSSVFSIPGVLNEIMSSVDDLGVSSEYSGIIGSFLSISGGVMFVIFTVIAAIGVLVNVFGMRKIHCLAKSTYQSVYYGSLNIQCANTAKIWLFIFGGCSIVTALGGGIGIIINGSEAAASIISGLLINKYFPSEKQF